MQNCINIHSYSSEKLRLQQRNKTTDKKTRVLRKTAAAKFISEKFLILLFILSLIINLRGDDKKVLNSRFAGSWYPGKPEVLKKMLKGFSDNATQEPVSNPIALILPHAGYRFSGQTAMYGIKSIIGKDFKKVIIIGPSHHHPLWNKVSIPKKIDFYKTALGKVGIEQKAVDFLHKLDFVTDMKTGHYSEHSVQIELPLLQFGIRNNFKIIPIVCGNLNKININRLAEALKQIIDEKTLVVASSDFMHYGRRFSYIPFDKNISQNIKKYDFSAYKCIKLKSAEKFTDNLKKTANTICGKIPIKILLNILPENSEAEMLNYSRSGEITGSFKNSVSYMAVVFTGKWNLKDKNVSQKEIEKMKDENDFGLSQKDKKILLKAARESISYVFKKEKVPSSDDIEIKITPGIKQEMGAFVTLHKNERLRGCIGEIIARRPLYEAVVAQAVNSAFRDYRFPQLQPSELEEIDIEISALSPPEKIDSYEDIKLGKHGIIIEKGGKTAVFLPQVAPEQNWTLEETLTHLSIKAGLSSDAWRKGAEFKVFEADVFHEKR